ncbi:NMD3 family protein [Trichomonas vaginalis G3]|uniref:60S ribosomal export protein NMD3 n=1 Tax=Trichomonas vaginalis (strain ATCC PRA-98 / G3) TaxID=412133 RepID=A2DEM9_TRIV3|nr:nonsense-mediated mRNA decay protein 3 family [Trichomonas vaginalis G3]EAY21156.1 NMD3 family protein [Trichomonas vaginalis G3]KAI5522315.1 nonsense-mediated mRNA decay protein 3 family [Trichomonas vaginalis G3]|eukprot:XP_001582142.1 NMD3 family protein [Trichomonas vaginalis G3]
MTEFTETLNKIPCCICGIMIEPNPSNMCVDCLQKNYSISDKLPQSLSVNYCRGCGRYQENKNHWINAPLESPELLKICLSRLTNVKDAKIVDAKFLYTEPHSRRIRVELTLESVTPENVTLRQSVIVTYVVTLQQCPDCQEAATPRAHWNSNVQLRQAGNSKRLLFWIEQQILTYNAHEGCTGVVRVSDGLDFHYPDKAGAGKLVNFVKSKIPILTKESGKLLSEDFQSMTADVRFSFLVRLPPMSRQDLIVLPKEIVSANGNHSHVALVHKISKIIRLVDPFTGRFIDIDAITFWKKPFEPVFVHEDLKRFVVLNVEHIDTNDRDCRFDMADVEITDEETYEDRFIVRTHLGGKLREGFVVLCYDRRITNIPDTVAAVFKKKKIPEIIIAGRAPPEKKPKMKVKELTPHLSDDDEQFNAFMEDLVDDSEMRQDVNIYKEGTEEKMPEEEIEAAIEQE